MRNTPSRLLLVALLGALAGCFDPVELLPGGDASLPPNADAGSAPSCQSDSDCPAPQAQACTPKKAVCQSGLCAVVDAAPIWAADPGACATAADCDCQTNLPHDLCVGRFLCTQGRCEWACNGGEACADMLCDAGQVCVSCGTDAFCVAGCRDSSDCAPGQLCDPSVCDTAGCPCAAQCRTAPACASDAECPRGSVCEGCNGQRTCVPGCHEGSQCGAGEVCDRVVCATCPCPGRCTTTHCQSKADCAAGQVCFPLTGAAECVRQAACVNGCLSGADCGADQYCDVPDCDSLCGCVGTCRDRNQCIHDQDCPLGTVCDFAALGSSERTCVPGCHDSSQCGINQFCNIGPCPLCVNCPCVGACEPVVKGCLSDSECGPGLLCVETGQSGSGVPCIKGCMPACRTNRDCASGETCAFAPTSGLCGADHGRCVPNATGCKLDSECPRGTICAETGVTDPNGVCQRACIAGCRNDWQCPGGACAPPPPAMGCGYDHGTCAYAPVCSSDADCGPGLVCGETSTCSRACVPGCRGDAECGPGQVCSALACDACGCGTPRCVAAPGCTSDVNCPSGQVCERSGPACAPACVSGCHSDFQCPRGSYCLPVPCMCAPDTCCACPGQCSQQSGCSLDSQCPAGEVCEMGQCVFGCHDNTQCPVGDACYPVVCAVPPCPAQCAPVKSGCTGDFECPAGQVCELGTGCTQPSKCVTGCRGDWQCKPGETCEQRMCFTCPCPAVCTPMSPCTDADQDGYAAQCGVQCVGFKGQCDCDDRNPRVNAGAPELCGNLYDDDCDGTIDDGCGCVNSTSCTSTAQCQPGITYCENGCCASCPMIYPIDCLPGQQIIPGRPDANGCPGQPTCGPVCTCPDVYMPVCGADYVTYGNSCEANCVGATVLHTGECAQGEGQVCSSWTDQYPPCPAGLYCRDTCPMCGSIQTERCTLNGACVWDYDCPAGLTAPSCTKGPGTWTCVTNKCQFSCP